MCNCLRGSQVHDQFEVRRLLDRNLRRLCAAQNSGDDASALPKDLREAWSIAERLILPSSKDLQPITPAARVDRRVHPSVHRVFLL